LPKFDNVKYYLFVAIDRATKTMYYEMYDAKTSENAEDFINKCLTFSFFASVLFPSVYKFVLVK
jgi:hypothetical protein